ncbi:MAG TPA: DUF4910 domain-containing protein, partial [Planctomycetota bacterium]|nr:DUF4910 domain-containing protein [Planctomycetota bacterium]
MRPPAGSAGGDPLMWDRLIDLCDRHYDGARHHALLARICADERWFDTPRQRAAAETMLAAMRDARLDEARIVPFAADGRTRFQDWTTKLAWECRAARLVLDGDVLADRALVPWAAVMGCGPLAAGRWPVVDIDGLASVDRATIAGRLVLGSEPPIAIKRRVRGLGAAGVVSDWIGTTVGADDGTTKWANAWGDGPGAWFVGADEVPLAGFCLSPSAGRRLRDGLRARPGLLVDAHCDARLYPGESHCVTAIVPGRDPAREVWLFGHACEPGANDNTSGVATLIEVARLLRAAIDAGDLPRPRASIRIITTEECLGMLAFATMQPELTARALCGINVDTVGDRTDAARPHRVFYGPLSAPSPVWAVGGVLGERLRERAGGAWHFACAHQVPCADDMIADPALGVPNIWIGRGADGVGYHSSADVPEVCEALPLRCNALLAAGTAYLMADLDRAWDDRFAADLAAWVDARLLPAATEDGRRLRRWSAARLFADAARWGVPADAIARASARYGDGDAAPLPGLPADGPVYRRATWGTGTFIDQPAHERRFDC